MSGEEIQEMDKFKYLGMISVDGCMGKEVAHRLLEGRKLRRTVGNLCKESKISSKAKIELFERVVIPTVVYALRHSH